MSLIFLADAALNFDEGALAGGALGAGLIGVIMAILAFVIIASIVLYIYMSLTFMAIAKRGKSRFSPGIAWIPAVGPALIASDIAGMHWWPILLLIGYLIPWVGILFGIAFAVFMVIWMWKTFEALKRPGWWAIFMIIPVLNIVFLVFLGIAAWGKN